MKKLFLLFLFLSACQHTAKGRNSYDRSGMDLTPVDGGTYVEASIGEPSVLNPILATDSASGDINRLVYNGLVKYDKENKLVGELANTWTISKDGKVITFDLKKGVTWHDGRPFTSEDVLFTYQMLIASTTRTPYSSDYLIVKKAETPDPHTFRVTYKEPFSPALASWGMGLIPKHIYKDGDINKHPANRDPIGTGPYIFKKWVTEEKVELEPNLDYFEGRPHFDRYIYRIIPDQTIQFLQLRQGTLSVLAPRPDQYEGYDEFFWAYNKYRYPSFSYNYIGFNLKKPLFQDKRIRKAIAHAINKDLLIRGIFMGYAVETTGPFPPVSWGSNPNVTSPAYDPEKAKQLLSSAGWEDADGDGIREKGDKPLEFTLTTNHGNDIRKLMAQIVQSDLKKVGIQMNVRIIEWSVFIQRYINKREFEATLLGWNLSRDPDAYSIWHSSQLGEQQYNFVSYKNDEVDRLLDLGRRTYGVEKRQPIYHRIHEIIADDLPYIFLVTSESLPVVHKKIIGVEQTPGGIMWNFNDWFVPKPWQTQSKLAS